ncbi:hypothetical protein MWG07_12080 [Fusobacterium necrophorum]|uniref:Uncharacterized protein n=1 Tax=Fusobacterium necrophorum TaxID=859 RepID=A0AAW6WDW5_9FUSO|nr:hypothetical protein [Fusobacterium necrophorum]MDK4475526.1 hypothetical protein [Fusobacterium necrophorum]MDK4481875.1 hypothetical protein [Fusobacterium necrophorum]MDK4512989.1 hypothetical protein [Fusobacterium necrophorum]
MKTTIFNKEGVIIMEQEVREKVLQFLQELKESGKLKSESEELVEDLLKSLSKEKVSQEFESKVFKTIEILKQEYLFFGILAGKVFE